MVSVFPQKDLAFSLLSQYSIRCTHKVHDDPLSEQPLRFSHFFVHVSIRFLNGLDIVHGMNPAVLCMSLHFLLGMSHLIVADHKTHHNPGGHVLAVCYSHDWEVVRSPAAVAPVLCHRIHKSQGVVEEARGQSRLCLVGAAASQEAVWEKGFCYCSHYANPATVAERDIGLVMSS
jgi:hypothetical protein